MVNLYDNYKQAKVVNLIPDNSQALMKMAMMAQQQDSEYNDQVDKLMLDFEKNAGVPIKSSIDRDKYYQRYNSAKSKIGEILSDNSIDSRSKYRSVMSTVSNFANDPLIKNIQLGSKNMVESLAKIDDEIFLSRANSFAENYDTENMGLFSRAFTDKFDWSDLIKKASDNIKPTTLNSKGMPDPRGEFEGTYEGDISSFIENNAADFYNTSSAKDYYGIMYHEMSPEERLNQFKSDYNAKIPRKRAEMSQIGIMNYQDRLSRQRERERMEAEARNKDPEINFPTVVAHDYASSLLRSTVKARLNEQLNKGLQLTDSSGKPITAELISMMDSNPMTTYSVLNSLQKNSAMRIDEFPMQSMMSLEANNFVDNSLRKNSSGNAYFVPGDPSMVYGVKTIYNERNGNYASFKIGDADDYLSRVVRTGKVYVPEYAAGTMYKVATPSGSIGAVVKASLGSSDDALMYTNQVVSSGTGTKINYTRKDIQEAIDKFVENGVITDNNRRGSFTYSDIYKALNVKGKMTDAQKREISKIEKASGDIIINISIPEDADKDGNAKSVKSMVKSKEKLRYNMTINAPIVVEQFNPMQSGTNILSASKAGGSVKPGQTVIN